MDDKLVCIKRTGRHTGLVFYSQPMTRAEAERLLAVQVQHVGNANLRREIVPV